MAVYTISDLHLPLGIDKPMDIFGKSWSNYVERLRENWLSLIKPEDTVVLGGDFSWATYLEQTEKDFEYLSVLPGQKILLKGNHDYWWTTANKLNSFLSEKNFKNIRFLHNNFFTADGIAIAGTRGWIAPQGTMNEENTRLYARELLRLEASIKAAKASGCEKLAVFMHYPPLLKDFRHNGVTELLEREGITDCYYGHLHKSGSHNAFEGEQNGVNYRLCAADYLEFMPILVD